MAADRRFKIFAAADGFGQPLKDAVVAHLRAHPAVAEVVDLGVDKYYAAAAAVARQVSSSSDSATGTPEVRGVVVCGTGAGVCIFANKYPRVYATHCASPADAVNTRSARPWGPWGSTGGGSRRAAQEGAEAAQEEAEVAGHEVVGGQRNRRWAAAFRRRASGTERNSGKGIDAG
ncbi:unnamed protein product [Urochloa humidicola]